MRRITILILTILASMAVLAGCGSAAASSTSAPASSSAASASSSAISSQASSSTDVSSSADTSSSASSQAEEKVFTLEELATYNGKDGQPAYVAVDGVVYDVTASPEWTNGEHKMGVTAGQDLTDIIKEKSPHGVAILEKFPVVGKLAE